MDLLHCFSISVTSSPTVCAKSSQWNARKPYGRQAPPPSSYSDKEVACIFKLQGLYLNIHAEVFNYVYMLSVIITSQEALSVSSIILYMLPIASVSDRSHIASYQYTLILLPYIARQIHMLMVDQEACPPEIPIKPNTFNVHIM